MLYVTIIYILLIYQLLTVHAAASKSLVGSKQDGEFDIECLPLTGLRIVAVRNLLMSKRSPLQGG